MATPNVQPTTIEISEIVQCAGGTFSSDTHPAKCDKNRMPVLITDKKDRKLWTKYQAEHHDVMIVNCEGFMQSVVQQKIRFPEYKLV